ncbi:FxsB family cyclophane-forming radical SAM/SPASM peptide maturase [Streptomyces purpureus]|uniref:FxsB family cyclophane-forming radical SAM/SPASM peptide maturase n=1 Tax=Streptomyces purpureus TaxID=1951 RepID=UPI00037D558A|nr:FxsB family cyclophane-forming radical SAM/SPASM peptide maturase [Streptomyces purpureus]
MDRPPPSLSQFVVKVHSRCDLACDHCYVYEHADTSWRGRPKTISRAILARSADRIAEHARAHGLTIVHVVLHGGEPLLAGPAGLRMAAEEFHRATDGVTTLDLRIHTNGVLLNERFLDLFDTYGIKVGVSLDGDREANDRHRRFRDGRSSHAQVLKAVELLNRPAYRHLFAGLLCTIDIENDPVAVYDALVALDPPRIDFLLPHATWDEPPPRPGAAPAPYADWLMAVHDRWDAAGRPVPVRMFESIRRTLRGESSLIESLGLTPADLVVIETDGTFEQADSLKTAYDGAPATGMDVFSHTLDDVLAHPGMAARRQSADELSAQCRDCPVVTSCGGGLYAHRYRTGPRGGSFDHPSVYCPDLLALITAVRDREEAAAPAPRAWPATADDLDGFDALAAGHGDAATVAALRDAQTVANWDLLAAVRATATSDDRTSKAAWELLTALDTDAPDALDSVLAHPWTRPWATRTLQHGTGPTGGLAELAAAAALRARRGDTVTVPLRGRRLRLPGLGVVILPDDADGAPHAQVTAEDDDFTVRAGRHTLRIAWSEGVDGCSPYWHPVRVVELPGWSPALEDTDPLREHDGWPVTARTTGGATKIWAEDLTVAWTLLTTQLPDHADLLAESVRSVVPLRAPDGLDGPDGGLVATTSRQVTGAVGTALPASPDLLALLLLRSCRLLTLGALLDRYALYHPRATDPTTYGPLAPAYAALAVADFWHARLRSGAGQVAESEFASWRARATAAVQRLDDAPELTLIGARFVARMHETLAARYS